MKYLQTGFTSFIFSSLVAHVVAQRTLSTRIEQLVYENLPNTYSVDASLVKCNSPISTVQTRTATPGDIFARFQLGDIVLPSYMNLDICRTTLNNQVQYVGTINPVTTFIPVTTNETDRWTIRINFNPTSNVKCNGPNFINADSKVLSFRYNSKNTISNPYKYNLGYMADLCVKSLNLLSKVAINEIISVPADYAVSFDIKPLESISKLASILHFSQDKTDAGAKGRVPAIWFNKGTTNLMVRVATTANANEGIASSVKSLPLNTITNVRVEAIGLVVSLYLNNTLDSKVTVSAKRISGEATLFVSDPWCTPAKATIGTIRMKSIKIITSAGLRNIYA